MIWLVRILGQIDHEHCEDFLTESDCGMHSECEWHENQCEDADTSDDGPECVQDCAGILDVNNEDVESVCNWFSSLGGVSNECFSDCSDEELEFPMMLESLCSCNSLSESDCADSTDCSFGPWGEDVGCWPNFVLKKRKSIIGHAMMGMERLVCK